MHACNADGKGEVDVLDDGNREIIPISLEDVLVFATGAASVPPMGFSERPRIVFKEDSASDLPTASTCSNTLYVPTVHHNSYDKFKYKFVFGVTGAVGFGTV